MRSLTSQQIAVMDFLDFVTKRHALYLVRAKGGPPPWTTDDIMNTYRFCNVYRELDRVTMFIRKKYTGNSPALWFDLVVARLLNEPWSLRQLPVFSERVWDEKLFIAVLQARQVDGDRVFNPAYIVSTNGRAMDKIEYLAKHVLTPMWGQQGPNGALSLGRAHKQLMKFQGLGSFMAAQVVADLKNTKGQALQVAHDWWTWAAPGPGSLRGLNRIMGRGAVKTWPAGDPGWLTTLQKLQEHVHTRFDALGWKLLCAQDVQNCLCEFDKYERVRLGEGKPKQLFRPRTAAST